MKSQYIMLGGRSCSGKNYFSRPIAKGGLGLIDREKFIIPDIDAIKKQLLEYSGDEACSVHQESCEIFEQITEEARANGCNVAHELTMLDPAQTLVRVKEFVDAGYEIRAYYMFLPPQVATERALDRFAGKDKDFSGIFIPPEAIFTLQSNNEATFAILKEFVREWRFYDNQGTKPILLDSGSNDEKYSILEDELSIQFETVKGITKITPDGTVITSNGIIIEPVVDEPFRDDKGEILCFANSSPILLKYFINDPG